MKHLWFSLGLPLLMVVLGCGRKNVETPFVEPVESNDFTDQVLKRTRPVLPNAEQGKGGTQSGRSSPTTNLPTSTDFCYWEDASGYVSFPGTIKSTFQDSEKNFVAEGGGCVAESVAKASQVLRHPDTLQWDESDPRGDWDLPVEAPYYFGIKVGHKNNPFPFIVVKWDIAWKHRLLVKSPVEGAIDIQYQKVWGEETLEHWSGRIVLVPLNDKTTSFSMQNLIRGKPGTAAEGKIDQIKSNRAVIRILENVRAAINR